MANDIASLGIVVETKGVAQAEQQLHKLSRTGEQTAMRAKEIARTWGPVLGAAVAAGAAAASAAVVKWSLDTARLAGQVDRLSKISNAATLQFQRQAAAAQTVGIANEKLADIFKDVNDKVGEFLQTGGGELKDFFDKIAPKVGVTAEQFRKLSGPDALQLYVTSLEKAGVGQSEMVFYLEAIADEASALVPLLRNNGRAMRELGDEAQRLGSLLDDEAMEASKALNAELWRLEQGVQGLKLQIGAQAIPVLKEFVRTLNDPQVRDGAASLVSGMIDVGRWAVEAAAKVGNLTAALREYMGENAKKGDTSLQNRLTELQGDEFGLKRRIRQGAPLLSLSGGPDPLSRLLGLPANDMERLKGNQAEQRQIEALLERRRTDRLVDNAFAENAKRRAVATEPPSRGTGGGTGNGRGSGPRAAEVDPLADAYARLNAQLSEQIALFGQTGEAARLRYQLEEGELSRLAPVQKAELLGKAELLDFKQREAEATSESLRLAAEEADVRQRGVLATQDLIGNMQFELDLLRMTADERERAIALRHADANATDEQRAAIVRLADETSALRESTALMDGFKSSMADAFTDIVTGSKSAKDAFKDLFDDLARQITRAIANKWIEQLFNSAGSGGGGFMGSLLSSGGGRAIGGPVSAGGVYQVGEHNRPELLRVHGKQYLIPGDRGQVQPTAQARARNDGMPALNQTFVIQGRMDRSTESQLARRVGLESARAMKRNG